MAELDRKVENLEHDVATLRTEVALLKQLLDNMDDHPDRLVIVEQTIHVQSKKSAVLTTGLVGLTLVIITAVLALLKDFITG
jgi:hypothetical protein